MSKLSDFLTEHNIKICIPTKGRVGLQRSVKNFHEDVIKNNLLLFHDKTEQHEYPSVICPDHVTSLREKRNYIIDYATEHKFNHIFNMDDDLDLKIRDSENNCWKNITEDEMIEFLKIGLNYDLLFFDIRVFNTGKDCGIKENKVGANTQFYKVSSLEGIRSRTNIHEDADIFLQLIRNGKKFATHTKYIAIPGGPKVGGTFEDSNFNEKLIENALHFAEVNSDIVDVLWGNNRGFRGMDTGFALRINVKSYLKRKEREVAEQLTPDW
jgi:hypothetical protein